MKGIVFTEFLEMVENEYGLELVQKIIDECELESGGVYTTVGTYSHKEMFKMVAKLSELKNVPVQLLLELYGEYFFKTLSSNYSQFLDQPNVFEFLESIDNYIHPEVLKLYPDAELPFFKSDKKNNREMSLLYQSSRKLSDFAVGLIRGAASYYNEEVIVEKSNEDNEGDAVLINIKTIG